MAEKTAAVKLVPQDALIPEDGERELGVKHEVREDGSIAYFAPELAAAVYEREAGS